MSIKKSQNKNGTISWYISCQYKSQRHRGVAEGAITRDDAKQYEKKILDEMRSGVYKKRLGLKDDYLFNDVLARAINSKSILVKNQKSNIKIVSEYLDCVKLSDSHIACMTMREDMLKKGLANSSINRRINVVKRILNLAFSDFDLIDVKLADKIKLLPENNKRYIYLTQEEVQKIVDACENENEHVKKTIQSIILIAAYSGLRRSEIWRLKADDYTHGKIKFKRKNGRVEFLPVAPKIQKIMHDTIPVSVGMDCLKYNFNRAKKRAGLDHVNFHDLRHSFASWLAQDTTTPASVIRDLMGHGSLDILSRYTHINFDTLERAVSQFSESDENDKKPILRIEK